MFEHLNLVIRLIYSNIRRVINSIVSKLPYNFTVNLQKIHLVVAVWVHCLNQD